MRSRIAARTRSIAAGRQRHLLACCCKSKDGEKYVSLEMSLDEM
jgi:hypothetical protein